MRKQRGPDPLVDSMTALVAARSLITATELGIFDSLHDSPGSAADVAGRLGLDELGVEALLTAMVAMGYAEQTGDGGFANSEAAERYLVRSSPESVASFVGAEGNLHWEILGGLSRAVRTGEVYELHESRHDATEHWEAYMRGLYEISRADHARDAALVPVEEPRRLVDVAGGHGGFSIAMCRRHPELRATIVDLAPAAEVGQAIVAEQGFADRIEFAHGDVFELGLGKDADVVSTFNLAHHLTAERNAELCRMAHDALRPGGCMLIGEAAQPEAGEPISKRGAISSLLFYAQSHARNYTPSEIQGWMEQAGFREVRVQRNLLARWRIVVVGIR